MDNGADSVGFADGPDEVGYAGGGDKVCLDSKEMADLVNGKPNGGQAAKPKEKEADIISGVCA